MRYYVAKNIFRGDLTKQFLDVFGTICTVSTEYYCKNPTRVVCNLILL